MHPRDHFSDHEPARVNYGVAPMLRGLSGALLLALVTMAVPAKATDCAPASGISSCVDANPLWMAAGQARFVSIASPQLTAEDTAAFGVGASYLRRPIALKVPSPDPEGREVAVVDHVVDASLLFGLGIAKRWEITTVMPMALHQTGAGADGATSQRGTPLDATAVRDPRVGVGYGLLQQGDVSQIPGLAAKARLELSLPLGDEAAYAGEPGPVLAPSLALALELGRVTLGSEFGARIRQTTTLATARIGSQLFSALGVAVDILDGQLLGLGAEAWLAPMLASQDTQLRNGTRIEDALLVPAEWLFSIRSAPTPDDDVVVQLGAGMGIPMSTETRVSPGGDRADPSHFLGVTTPAYRAVLTLRWVPPQP